MGLLTGVQSLRHRLTRINLLERQVSANPARLGGSVGGLVIIQVTVGYRSHYHIMAFRCSFAASSDPVHDHSILSQSALPNFAPANENPALAVDELFDSPHKVTLEFMLRFQAGFLHLRLAFPAFFPVV